MAVVPSLPLYIEERFGIQDEAEKRFWAALVFAAAPLTAACMGPFWGILGDRLGRKIMVLRASLAIAVVTALMPLATDVGWLTLLRVLQGAFAGYVAPALVLGTMGMPPHKQGLGLGRLQVPLALGQLLGPAIAAEVILLFNREAVFYMTSVLALLSAVPVWLWAKEDPAWLEQRHQAGPRGFRANVRGLLQNRSFVVLLLLILLLRFGQNMVEPYVALMVQELGALPLIQDFYPEPAHALERTVAAAFIILAIAQMLFTPLWGRLADRIGPLRCLAILCLSLALVYLAASGVQSIGEFMTLRGLGAVFMAGGMTLAYAAAGRRVTAESRSRAFAMIQSCMQFGLAVGPLAGWYLTQGKELFSLYMIGAVFLSVAGFGMLALRKFGVKAQQQPSQPLPEEP